MSKKNVYLKVGVIWVSFIAGVNNSDGVTLWICYFKTIFSFLFRAVGTFSALVVFNVKQRMYLIQVDVFINC